MRHGADLRAIRHRRLFRRAGGALHLPHRRAPEGQARASRRLHDLRRDDGNVLPRRSRLHRRAEHRRDAGGRHDGVAGLQTTDQPLDPKVHGKRHVQCAPVCGHHRCRPAARSEQGLRSLCRAESLRHMADGGVDGRRWLRGLRAHPVVWHAGRIHDDWPRRRPRVKHRDHARLQPQEQGNAGPLDPPALSPWCSPAM